MATFTRVPLWTTPWAIVRHKMKTVNTRTKRPMSIVKAKMLAATQYRPMKDNISLAERCAISIKTKEVVEEKVNPWKELLKREAKATLKSNQLVAVLHNSGVKAFEYTVLWRKLRKQGIELVRFPNLVMCETVENSEFQNMQPLFVGRNLYAVCKEPKVKELLKTVKNTPKIILLGGKVENKLMSVNHMVDYSKLSSLAVLQGQLVSILSTPAMKVSSLLQANQQQLTANLQQYAKQQSQEDKSNE
ncbi:large ribosomal subunit protein uL10m-like [Saccoglossus kowalevskii]|uniref:Large ribosomal subunit protein uL10m n=1 Tax=Saccoglossus kowalevskii TaxID=10224 RepID=A0ABM0GSX4_SACKO|nr:PREDICTED: 39S ribosomal protein L10, mitochondrial-like [Saccoglossus kowalevskii]